MDEGMKACPARKKCGGCDYQGIAYGEQLQRKQQRMQELLGRFGHVEPIIGMEHPQGYRNKVHHVLGYDRRTGLVCGFYEKDSHRVVDVADCMLEDAESQAIILTVKQLMPSFRLRAYDEDQGTGFLRHILVRRGFQSGEVMVVLVAAEPVFPGRQNFVRALRERHPEITTIVLNVNNKRTSMVLSERNIPLYGPGFIRDTLCGCTFRISPTSFYQVNPVQTEKLYACAVDFAGLTGRETVVDAYCGIGTIGLVASKRAARVIGVELNPAAVEDAVRNARENHVENVTFRQGDAGRFLRDMAARHEHVDVVMMDPPRSGSTQEFLGACATMKPTRIVYVSCGPDTLARDLAFLTGQGYRVEKIQPVDMFPWTAHTEVVVLMSRA